MTAQPLLGRLYTMGSLDTDDHGFRFGVKNRLFAATLTAVDRLVIDGVEVALAHVSLVSDDVSVPADDLGDGIAFPLRAEVTVSVAGPRLAEGPHELDVSFRAEPFGDLAFEARDVVVAVSPERPALPRDLDDDQSVAAVGARRRFLAEYTGATPEHLFAGSFDPHETRGNIENFVGVAQVPIGLAGPLLVDGEHARGEFLIPLATTEGTLVASYNRGMKALNLAGGVTCTVVDDRMQRAPVFEFDDARQARDFSHWVNDHQAEIAAVAESTTRIGRLVEIESYLASRLAFLRFDFTTGDAAGQNMVGRATFAACSWILERVPTVRRFWLEANFATDKKASHVNMMRTRGKRVTAEVTLPRAVLARVLRVSPESLHEHANVANIGSFLSGANNNGLHAANAVAAMFIATGQDAANVAESSAAVVHTEVTSAGDFYVSITLPSLILATHGGGTGLPTQRECLEILGCTERGSVAKLAEIVAGTVLAGEISLASAISSLDWVSSHEQYGRNR
ncbi:MAG: hydroxymethylglutaryl-CoA reductase [Acidimicrobiales bacterium]